jgi:choline dehydrogenase-like flavoprotein
MTIVDINTLENNSDIPPADICIIGAGAAGITIADAFRSTKHKVYLLESGGFEYDEDTQDLYEGDTNDEFYNPGKNRLRYFGGSTNHWAGYCAPLSKIDFEKRSWVPHSGWPITKADLNSYYKRAAKTIDLKTDDFDAEKSIPQKAKAVYGDLECNMWRFSPPTRFGRKYKKALKGAMNITTFLHANVTNIATTDNAKKVTHVDVRTLSGKQFRIVAKYFILATGGIENARLLLMSNNTVKAGLGNQNDLVGRFFTEHPHFYFGALIFYSNKKHPLHNFSQNKNDLLPNITLTEKAQKEHELLNFSAELTTLKKPGKFLHRAGKGILRHLREVSYSDANFDQIVKVTIRSEQAPSPENRITLIQKKDVLDCPRIQLEWQLKAIDWECYTQSLNYLAQLFGQEKLGLLKAKPIKEDKNIMYRGGSHHMCTTRMHDDPKQGVVDKNCKLHGTDNMYVAGSSVFTTAGWANPTYTLVALAHRLADHLKEKL